MVKQARIPIRITPAKEQELLTNQYAIYGQAKTQVEEVKKEIDFYLNEGKEDVVKDIIFLGDFAQIEKSKQEAILQIVFQYKIDKKINNIIIGTRPNTVTKEALKLWKKYKVDFIELEVQSSNPYILEKINAPYRWEEIKDASKKIRWNGFKLGLQMAVGLPESTSLDEQNTAKMLLKLKPKMVRIYPIVIIKNTKLEELWKNGEYEPISIEIATERCKDLVYLCNEKRIPNIWVGIPNEGKIFDTDKKIIAGPFHPELAQMVESSIWYDSVVEQIKKLNTKVKVAQIKVNSEDVAKVIGYDEENRKKLKELYDVELEVKGDGTIKLGKSEISILKTYEDLIEKI